MGKREIILRASFIQIPETPEHSYFSIILWYGHNIRYPLGLVHMFNEPYFQLLSELFFDL